METLHDNTDPLPWLWEDPYLVPLDFPTFGASLDTGVPLLPQSEGAIHQQPEQSNQWDGGDPPLIDFNFLSPNLGSFPDFDFSMCLAQIGMESPHSVWTASAYTDSIACPSITSDVSSLSPSQMSMTMSTPPSFLPFTPRPLAPLQHCEPFELANGQGDRTVQVAENPMVNPTTAFPSPPQTSTRPRNSRRRRDPSFIPARQIRQLEKPEKCPICQKGHQYRSDVKRHIASRHKDRAHEFGVSIALFLCPVSGCFQTFPVSRLDHALRHIRRKHKDHDGNTKAIRGGKK
ncbi:hypothetical protein QC762_609660 [Podospora pseudocomata]|uniref:C2H2-type domain-containing protein n=1 Tax=Podospora pseudocomata TaxID=2093779 RepID=A0ABR0G964_9PEZI|nr:hypothetical protein QC762_609660 [Podospora pseudocomata]